MGEAKIHRRGADHGPEARTLCGLYGWRSPPFTTEFDTAEGRRFEAVTTDEGVNCLRCLKRMHVRWAREDQMHAGKQETTK